MIAITSKFELLTIKYYIIFVLRFQELDPAKTGSPLYLKKSYFKVCTVRLLNGTEARDEYFLESL